MRASHSFTVLPSVKEGCLWTHRRSSSFQDIILNGTDCVCSLTYILKVINRSSFSRFLFHNCVRNLTVFKKELNELIEAGLSLSAASKYLGKKENISKSIIYKLH